MTPVCSITGWTGVDFSRYRPEDELRYIETEAMRSALASFTSDDPDRVWTVRELAEHVAIGGRGPLFVGSPEQIADTLDNGAGMRTHRTHLRASRACPPTFWSLAATG